MPKAMLDESEWGKNVGTAGFPVSFLHEYAVGLIWDALNATNAGPVTLPTLEGGMSDDVLAGVDKVIIPDNLNAVAGYVPDILCLRDSRPVRLIEVVVTSTVTAHKLTAITNLGVKVVQVPVRNEDELMALFPDSILPEMPRWWTAYRKMEAVLQDARRDTFESIDVSRMLRPGVGDRLQQRADQHILDVIRDLRKCSPLVRRDFLALMREIGTLESLYPLRPDGPKYKTLFSLLSNEST